VMLAFFAVLTAGLGALYCVAGVALQRGRRWARIMTLVLAGLAGVLALSGPVIWVRADSRPARATVFLPTTAPGPGPTAATVPSPPPGMSLEHILWHVAFCLAHGAYAAGAFLVLLHKQYALAFR